MGKGVLGCEKEANCNQLGWKGLRIQLQMWCQKKNICLIDWRAKFALCGFSVSTIAADIVQLNRRPSCDWQCALLVLPALFTYPALENLLMAWYKVCTRVKGEEIDIKIFEGLVIAPLCLCCVKDPQGIHHQGAKCQNFNCIVNWTLPILAALSTLIVSCIRSESGHQTPEEGQQFQECCSQNFAYVCTWILVIIAFLFGLVYYLLFFDFYSKGKAKTASEHSSII